MGWGGRREGGSGWGTHVNPWLIHVNVRQKPLQHCKVISLQLIKNKEKNLKIKKKKERENFPYKGFLVRQEKNKYVENLLLDILNYFEDFSLRVYKVKELLVRIIRKKRINKREVKQMVEEKEKIYNYASREKRR